MAEQPIATSGAEFYRRFMLFLSLMSSVAVAIISLYLYALLRLSAEEWRAFLWVLAFLAPVMFIGTSLINRPLYGPVLRYLDAERETGEAGQELLWSAFRATSNMPYQFFLSGLLWWSAAGAFVAGVLAWQFDGFGAFRAAMMLVASGSGGFVCSVFMFFGLKRFLTPLRHALGEGIVDPAERQGLIRHVALARKLRWSVTGVTLVTVAFALFLSLVHVSEPLEANAVEIQARFLAARAATLSDDPLAFDAIRAEARELGIAEELVIVELDAEVGDEVVAGNPEALVDAELDALSGVAGRSLDLHSPNAFAWHPLGESELLVAVQPWDRIAPPASAASLRFALTLLVSVLIALGLAQELSRDIGVNTQRLGANAERVAGGDLRRSGVFESEDELGELARSFERMAGALRETVGRVSETADRVEATASETTTVSGVVAAAGEAQSRAVVETAREMQSLTGQVTDISAAAEELNLLVEDAGSSMMELGASGEQLAETAGSLLGTVDEVSGAIQESAQSMREVSSNAGALAQVADDTSASSSEMAQNMREVNEAAEDSARRSQQVVETAERGRETVRQTVDSMTSIRDATDSAEKVIRGLGERATEIGSIVDVIGDVADETNLLALNAAIIAAQAGEQGRAFSVVAEEIKELADRVLSSTKEIAQLIQSVQDESGNAVDAMAAGASSVAQGVRLSMEAGEALEEITQASRESGEQIDQILGAVQEQTRASSYVVEQMATVKSGVDAIQRATAEQDRGNGAILHSTESMRDIAQQLQSTTAEQARGSRRIRESIEGVRTATESINTALRLQSSSAGQVSGFLQELSGRGETNDESAARMQEVTRQLREQAEALREDVERFRV